MNEIFTQEQLEELCFLCGHRFGEHYGTRCPAPHPTDRFTPVSNATEKPEEQ